MKRLYACVGLSLLVAFTIVFYFGIFGSVFLFVTAIGLVISGLFVKKYTDNRPEIIAVAVVLVFGCVYSNLYTQLYFNPQSEKYNEKTVNIVAELVNPCYHSYNSYCYDLSTSKVDDKKENIKLLLRVSNELDIDCNDTIKCRAVLKKCDNDYYKSKGYLYTAKAENYYLDYKVIKAESKGFSYYVNEVKNSLLHRVSTIIPGDEGQLCRTVALGGKYTLSSDLRSSFSKSGLSYLIVVSGLHMSIVAGAVLMLLKKVPKTRGCNAIRSVILIAVIFSFMVVAGLNPSVVRSGIMIIITFVGSLLRRKSDSFNSLGFAAFVLTVFNPYAVGDVGMLFSFASVVGIIAIYPRIMSYIDVRLNKYCVYNVFGRYLIDISVLSFSCVLCVTPISLLRFGTCNPLVIILSVFVTALISVLLICTLLCAILGLVPIFQGFAYLFGFVAYFVGKAVIFIVDTGSKIPFAKVTADPNFVRPFLLVLLLFIGFAMLFKDRYKLLKYITVISLIVAFSGWGYVKITNYDKLIMSIYSTGNGSTVVLRNRGICAVLSCGGDAEFTTDAIDRLNYSNDKIALLVVPSAKNYDSRYAREILTEFDVREVLLYYKYTTNEKTYGLAEDCELFDTFTGYDRININLLGGVKDRLICDGNRSWQYIYNDKVSVLLAPKDGDVGHLPKKYRCADVLVTSGELKNYNLLCCGNVVWTSEKEVPKYYVNAVSTKDSTFDINFK